MDFQETLDRLKLMSGMEPIKYSNGYFTLCPTHDDVGPSLSVAPTKHGTAALYCFAGCDYLEIRKAIEVGQPIIQRKKIKVLPPPWEREIERVYPYENENGNAVYEKIRFVGKSFCIRRPNGKWGMNGVKPILYKLPEVLESEVVFIVEGEKDVETMNKLGFIATTSYDGASKGKPKWLLDYNKYLEGKHVIILYDNDLSGKTQAKYIYDTLENVKSKTIVSLPGVSHKQDVSDWVELGNGRDDLIKLVRSAFASQRA